MKRISLFILSIFMGSLLFSSADAYAGYVKGYTKKNGTYVAPHYRSDPNGTKLDNWSTKGNYNPYTGKAGTKNITPNYYPSSSGSSYILPIISPLPTLKPFVAPSTTIVPTKKIDPRFLSPTISPFYSPTFDEWFLQTYGKPLGQ